MGFAVARLLGRPEANVVIGSTTERVQSRADELPSEGIAALAVAGDLTSREAAAALVTAAVPEWGRLDIVVNNAGMISGAAPGFQSGTVAETDLDTWHRSLDRNLDTALLLTNAAVPEMARQRCGRVVMVFSVTGPVMAIRADVVATAKAGLVGFCRAPAVDLASAGRRSSRRVALSPAGHCSRMTNPMSYALSNPAAGQRVDLAVAEGADVLAAARAHLEASGLPPGVQRGFFISVFPQPQDDRNDDASDEEAILG